MHYHSFSPTSQCSLHSLTMATNRDLTSPVEMRRMSMKISTVFHLRGHFPLCTKPGTRNNCPHFNFNGTCIKYFCQWWEIIVFVAIISTE